MAIEAAKLQVTVGADTSQAEQGIQSFGQKMNSTAKNLGMMGGALSLGLTAPILGVAKAGLDSAMDFEQSMNIMQQVTGATASEMEAMSAQALELGANTSFSAGEAADAMLELGKAGMDTTDIMDSIAGVMDLAAAGGVSLAEAANLTASTLNAFGLEAVESTRIANIMAATANASAADISDLGQGMQQAGFAFDMANQPVENLAASLAILTNVGLTGSDAGTALKNAFMRMMNPTEEAKGVMTDLGISFYDAAGNMKMLPDIIDMLNASTAGLTDQQRDAALATIFLSDGMKAFIPLMEAGGDSFRGTVETISEGGAASDVAAARMGGLSGAIEYLKGSVDSFLIGAALPFLDTISGFVRGGADLLSTFGALPQPVINAGLAFAGILAAAGPVMLALSGLTAVIGFLTTTLAGPIIVAIAAFAAAWAADIGGIQAITTTMATSVLTQLQTLATNVQNVAKGIVTAFSNTKFPSVAELWKQFKAGDFETVANTIRDTTYELMVNLDAELNITAKAQQLKQQLVDAISGMATAAGNLDFSSVSTKMNGLRDGILNGVKAAVDGVNWGGAGDTFKGILDGLKMGIQTMDLSGIDWVSTLSNMFLLPAKTALGAINWVVGSESFQGLVTSVGNAMRAMQWGDIGTSFAGLSKAVGTQIGQVAKDMVSDVTTAINEVDFNAASLKVADGISKIGVAISEMDWSTIGESVAQGMKGIGTTIKGLFTGERNLAAEFDQAVRDAFAEVNFDQLGVALQGLGASINTAIREFGSGFSKEFNIQTPDWVANLSNFVLSPPDWYTTLTTWNPTTPGWVSLLLAWELKQPGWITQLSQWASATAAKIAEFSWDNWIEKLEWSSEPNTFTWGTYIVPLVWSAAPGIFSWGTWITALVWATEPTSFSWGTWITELVWSEEPKNFRWSSWISKLTWPTSIFSFNWKDFITPVSVPQPSVGTPGGGTGGGGSGGFDDAGGGGGGLVAPGGATIPKLAPLTGVRGTTFGNGLNAAAEGINIFINATIANDMDLHDTAYKLGRQVRAGMR